MKFAHVLLAGSIVLALAGCGSSPSGSGSGSGSGNSAEPVAVKEAPTGEAKLSGTLEVQTFKGGYGLDFWQQVGAEFKAKHPGLEVTVDGSPDVATTLQPRFVNGNPPDLIYPGWKLNAWGLVTDGQVFTLDTALDSPAADGKGKWRDSFSPSVLKLGASDGKQYMMPYFLNVWGIWYNPDLFAKNGWVVPKTYEELLAVCAKIKAAGIAPITFQGKYPYYMLQGMVLPWVQDMGGIQAINDLQSLKPGAWKAPAVLKAVTMIKELKDKGYFEDGAVGLSHTESQTEFLHDKAAMIPCGTWLKSEMSKEIPPGAKIQFMNAPVAAGTGDPTAVEIDIEPWMVPVAAKNPDAAIAFYKYLTSVDVAKRFVVAKGTLTAIKGSDEVQLPDTLVEPAKAYKSAKTVWSYMAIQWYKQMESDVENALTSLLNGQSTPEQFCDQAEAAAQKVRDDSSITKHKVD